jgi:hypothetical protein
MTLIHEGKKPDDSISVGIGLAYPNQNPGCVGEDGVHQRHLVASLNIVILIDTDTVNPDSSRMIWITEVMEQGLSVAGDPYPLPINLQEPVPVRTAPYVRNRIVRLPGTSKFVLFNCTH